MPSEKRPCPLVLDASTESDDSDVVIVSTGRSATASRVARNPDALSAAPATVSTALPPALPVDRTAGTGTLPASSHEQGDADAAGGPQPLQGGGSESAVSGSTSDSDESSSHWDAVVSARRGGHGALPVTAGMPTMPVTGFVAGAPSEPAPSPPTTTTAACASGAVNINLHVEAAVTLSTAPATLPSSAVVHSSSTASTSVCMVTVPQALARTGRSEEPVP